MNYNQSIINKVASKKLAALFYLYTLFITLYTKSKIYDISFSISCFVLKPIIVVFAIPFSK